MSLLEEAAVQCPYCNEPITLLIDTSAGGQNYIEDCFVCCRPIVVQYSVDAFGQVDSISAQQEDD